MVAGLENLEGRQLLAGDVTLLADSFESGSHSNDWAGNWGEDSQNDWFRSTERSTDGVRSAEVDGWASNATRVWRSETVDLTPFASPEVLVRFRSQASHSNEDANVDNVRITAAENTNAVTTVSYPDFSDTSNLNLIGDAAAPFGRNNALRLMDQTDAVSARGVAWHADQQVVATAFETEFEFQSSGEGTNPFAFVIQNDDAWTFPSFNRGSYDRILNSVALEFDPNSSHIAVQSNGEGPNSWRDTATFGTGIPSFDIEDGQVHHARMSYQPGTMSIYLDHEADPTLTAAIDLAELLNLNNGRAWLGFTGGVSDDSYDILNWTVTGLGDTSTSISVSDAELVEGNSGTNNILFSVTRFGDLSHPASVNWATADDTAIATDNDYVPDTGQLDFAAGESEKTIAVAVNGDFAEESHEQFFVRLSNATDGFIGNSVAHGTILNDDVTLSIVGTTAQEGGGELAFLGKFGNGQYPTLTNNARALKFGPDGNVYVASNEHGVVRFDGQTGTPMGVFANSKELASARGLAFGPDGNLYVGDNNPSRVVRFNGQTGELIDVFVESHAAGLDTARGITFGPEGDLYVTSGQTHEVLRFDGSDGSFIEAFVTAESGGLLAPQSLTFHDGYLYVNSGINPGGIHRYDGTTGAYVDDFVPAGTAGLTLIVAGGLGFGPDINQDGVQDLFASSAISHELMIFDGVSGNHLQTLADSTVMTVGPGGLDFDADGNLYVVGGNDRDDLNVLKYGDNSQAGFEVTLSSPSAVPVTVDYDTIDGTAVSGSDYASLSSAITFEPGVTSRTIIVPTFDDAAQEDTETFQLALSNAAGATLVVSDATGTILDDGDVGNQAPTIDFMDFSDVSDLNLVGHAFTTFDDRLQLSDTGLRQGSAWHADQQTVSTAFETQFDFVLASNVRSFSFVIQNSRPEMLGGDVGFNAIPNSLAIEFDTHQRSKDNDPNNNHVSVQSRGIEHNHASEDYSLGTATIVPDMNDDLPHTAKIRYESGNLQVFVDDLMTPALSVNVDIDDLLDLDFGRAWVGFAAGGNRHEILNWQFRPLVDLSTTIGIHDAEILEGDSGTQQLVLEVQRKGPAGARVQWNTTDASAVAGVDYLAASGTIEFLAGGPDIQQVAVPILGDLTEEAFESLFVEIDMTADQAIIVDDRAVGTILNDDASLVISDASAVEGDPMFAFTDEFVPPAIDGLWVMSRGLDVGPDENLYVTVEQGPYPGAVLRYDGETGEFMGVFAAHNELDGAKDIEFGPDGNLYVTNNRTDKILRFDGATGEFIDVYVPAGGALSIPRAIVFGSDNNLYVANGKSDEILRYQGPLEQDPGELIDAFVTAGDGGMDNPTTLTFGPDGTLYVASGAHAIYNNSILRFDGTTGDFIDAFDVSGTSTLALVPTAGLIFGPDLTGDGVGELYASNGDGPAEILAFDPTTRKLLDKVVESGAGGLSDPKGLAFTSEGDLLVVSSGTRNILRYSSRDRAAFTATLSSPVGQTVEVDFVTTDGTANSTSDYVSTSGTLTIPRGMISRTIQVSTIDDPQFESDETFQVTLSNAVGAAISDGTGVATILSDDIPPLDYGDAPVSYGTLIDDDGAVHIAVGPQLGAHRDSETDAFPSTGADGDDVDGSPDDEDGVMFGVLKLGQTMAGVNIELQGTNDAKVDAWIDFNADGVWDAGEKILDSAVVMSGLQTLNYSVPPTMALGETYARVRVSTAGGLAPTGLAADGEVEDYVITIRQDVSFFAQPAANDVTVRLAGANVELIDNNSGTTLLTTPVTTTQSLQVSGTTGDDTFVVNYDEGGFFSLPDGIEIDAAGGSDSVVVRGTGTSTATLRSPDGTLAGAIVQVNDRSEVNEVRLVDIGPLGVQAMQSIQIEGSFHVAEQVLSLAATDAITLGAMTEFTGGRIEVTGPVTVGGTLKYRPPVGVTPGVGDSFVLVTATMLGGGFTSLDLPTPPPGADWDLQVGTTEIRLTLVDLAEVAVLTLGNGTSTTQRSTVTKVDVTFDGLVDVDADAFELRKDGPEGGLVTNAFTLATDPQNNSVATLTFSGSFTRDATGALVDGNYQLTIDPSKVRRAGTSVELDGNGDGIQGGDYTFGTKATDQFFALYGDTDGDRDVDGQDYGRFGLTFFKSDGDLGFDPNLDSDGDGDVDGLDYGRFGQRFLRSI